MRSLNSRWPSWILTSGSMFSRSSFLVVLFLGIDFVFYDFTRDFFVGRYIPFGLNYWMCVF